MTKILMPLLILASLAVFFEIGSSQQPFVVNEIRIVGNKNVATSEILKAVGFKPGDTVDIDRVKQAAQAIKDLGYFVKVTPDLSVEEGQVVVKFTVVEYPKIKHITLVGLPETPPAKTLVGLIRNWILSPGVSEATIRSILSDHDIKPGKVLNEVKLKEALKEVLEEFKKRDIATVQIGQVIPGEELVIEIQELVVLGHKFVGLATVPQEAVEAMITVPVGKLGRLSQIKASLDRLANSIYFTSANVVPEVAPGGVWLKWELSERELLSSPQELKGIELVGTEAIPLKRLEPFIGELPEGTCGNYDVLVALSEVNDYYHREGYFMVDFRPEGIESGVLKVRVLEGKIAQIEIKGHPRTSIRVIRRVMKLHEGEFLTESRFTAARQSLMSLGYFSDVTLTPTWQDQQLVLEVEVKELSKLGKIGGSVAFSPKEGLVGNIEYSQKNLFGTAQDVSITFSRGMAKGGTTWKLGYQGHAFPIYDLVSLNVYRKENPQDDGSKVTLGGEFSVAYPLDLYLDLRLGVTDEASYLLPQHENLPPRTALNLGLNYDSRDNPFFPRSGVNGHISVEKAGTFAPGVEYLSLSSEVARFWPIDIHTTWETLRAALAERALVRLGWDLPEDYLFKLGGSSSVRGAKTVSTDRMALLNSEFRVELTQGLALHFFWDLGADLRAGEVKSSLGLEISARIGGMYARIDMAWPSDRPWTWVPAFEFETSPLF
jgi:outer membrane protein insertion porin family